MIGRKSNFYLPHLLHSRKKNSAMSTSSGSMMRRSTMKLLEATMQTSSLPYTYNFSAYWCCTFFTLEYFIVNEGKLKRWFFQDVTQSKILLFVSTFCTYRPIYAWSKNCILPWWFSAKILYVFSSFVDLYGKDGDQLNWWNLAFNSLSNCTFVSATLK